MTLYRYLCLKMPPAPGSVPKRNLYGRICGRIGIQGGGHVYGIVDYTEPLNDEELEEYELSFHGTVDVSEEDHDA